MRQFVKNIKDKIETCSQIVACEVLCSNCVEFDDFHIHLMYSNYPELVILNMYENGKISHIKLHKEEYEYLQNAIKKLKEKQEDEFITYFTNLNDNN